MPDVVIVYVYEPLCTLQNRFCLPHFYHNFHMTRPWPTMMLLNVIIIASRFTSISLEKFGCLIKWSVEILCWIIANCSSKCSIFSRRPKFSKLGNFWHTIHENGTPFVGTNGKLVKFCWILILDFWLRFARWETSNFLDPTFRLYCRPKP